MDIVEGEFHIFKEAPSAAGLTRGFTERNGIEDGGWQMEIRTTVMPGFPHIHEVCKSCERVRNEENSGMDADGDEPEGLPLNPRLPDAHAVLFH
jgi:hypothetical protein